MKRACGLDFATFSVLVIANLKMLTGEWQGA